MVMPHYPLLYQLNTRVRLHELSRELGRPATLDDLPDEDLVLLRDRGFDWLWLLGVWQTGEAGRAVSRSHPQWREDFEQTLPDLAEADICGSCFAVTAYDVHSALGGNDALERLRSRIHEHGLRLMLDFVPNHVALDHRFVDEHPEFLIVGTEDDLAREPQNFIRQKGAVHAYGRDPYFDGWPDTLQLNYAEAGVPSAMADELVKIAGQCDGVRCDMAMLILPGVFEQTWGARPEPFWAGAIERVRAGNPEFRFMAEVYWDMEWDLQQLGFDYTYDKRLYDRLRNLDAVPVSEHLFADLEFQGRLARFLENHDEPRAAVTFPSRVHPAAAVLTYLTPGLRFFHQGQFEGRRRRISPHLCRGPDEDIDANLSEFYERLLTCLSHPAPREGDWTLLDCIPASAGNGSVDGFISFLWEQGDGRLLLVTVNYAAHAGQCRVQLPIEGLRGRMHRLADLLSPVVYFRNGDELIDPGLYLDLPPWGYHAFEIRMDFGSSLSFGNA